MKKSQPIFPKIMVEGIDDIPELYLTVDMPAPNVGDFIWLRGLYNPSKLSSEQIEKLNHTLFLVEMRCFRKTSEGLRIELTLIEERNQ